MVSNAPGGSSLRDVNAKTKVKTLAKIYSRPAGKRERIAMPAIMLAAVSNLFILFSGIAKPNVKGI